MKECMTVPGFSYVFVLKLKAKLDGKISMDTKQMNI
jgi:hypothetical protein